MSCSPASRWKRWSQLFHDNLVEGSRLRRNEFGPGAPRLGDRLPTPADRAPYEQLKAEVKRLKQEFDQQSFLQLSG